MGFDGVPTEDLPWAERGVKRVAASQDEGMGLARRPAAEIRAIGLSSETKPVVSTRCRTPGIEAIQALPDVADVRQAVSERLGVRRDGAIRIGNPISDFNNLPSYPTAGWAADAADDVPSVRAAAIHRLRASGGRSTERKLWDYILAEGQQR